MKREFKKTLTFSMRKIIFRGLIILRFIAPPAMPSLGTIFAYWQNTIYTNTISYAQEELLDNRLKQNLNTMYSF